MLVIKNFILDNDKIHAQIQENKKKPKKQAGLELDSQGEEEVGKSLEDPFIGCEAIIQEEENEDADS